ncbi:MAG: hypoxanthine-guanine phosphoribosyltransferase [Pseudomonadota bacterium]
MTTDAPSPADVEQVLAASELLHSPERVAQAYEEMATAITIALENKNPLVLAVLVGGLVPAGALMPRLAFPLELDYIHATRYRGEEHGKDVQWLSRPQAQISGRTVLIIDDILDEGFTLNAIVEYCESVGAQRVMTAVLVNKVHDRKVLAAADFQGLDVDDRYVFGCGMDYRGYLRNAPGIYALGD